VFNPATDYAGAVPEPAVSLPSPADLLGLLRGVVDPELGADVVELGMIRQVDIDDAGAVTVTVALTTAGCPLRAQIQRDIKTRVGSARGVTSVALSWTEMTAEQRATAMSKARWNARERAPQTAIEPTTRVIGVASGKGGVGKSSVTVNLAVALARRGLRVGVLDADIWGFSVPRMLGVDGRLEAVAGEKKMQPAERLIPARRTAGDPADHADPADGTTVPDGVLEVVSMGLLTENETDALMWRGLMLNRAVQHFLEDVRWGPLDYLLIDLPPGTGDVQMGLARMLPRTELLIVTTPALAAQKVAARAATMARKSYLRVAGVVENMSAFVAPDGTSYALFGEGGGQALADEIGVPLLASLPLDASVAAGGDHGQPVALGDGPMADAFARLAEEVVTDAVPPVDVSGCSARLIDAMQAAFQD
jgi:ATP-binding protein involved in chromosome partitioning